MESKQDSLVGDIDKLKNEQTILEKKLLDHETVTARKIELVVNDVREVFDFIEDVSNKLNRLDAEFRSFRENSGKIGKEKYFEGLRPLVQVLFVLSFLRDRAREAVCIVVSKNTCLGSA